MAKWVAAGREVHLLVLTNGDRGSSDPVARSCRARGDPPASRRRPPRRCSGLASVRCSASTTASSRTRRTCARPSMRRIREVRAETVLSVDPTAWFFENRYYNHSDHRTRRRDRARRRRSPAPATRTTSPSTWRRGWTCSEVHDIWLGWTNESNHIEDVSGYFDDEDRRAREAREPARRKGSRFFEEFLAKEAVRARREDRREPRRGLPRARSELDPSQGAKSTGAQGREPRATTELFELSKPPGQSVREGPAGDAGPSAYDAAAQSEQSVSRAGCSSPT